ncbi:MAG TPA: hypothetical protein VI542_30570, partial [Candidatus Tectomicrobia bacterium]
LSAIQAAAAMEEGLVSPAHLVIATFPCEQGSQRVTDATTLYKAQKTPGAHRRHHDARVCPIIIQTRGGRLLLLHCRKVRL